MVSYSKKRKLIFVIVTKIMFGSVVMLIVKVVMMY